MLHQFSFQVLAAAFKTKTNLTSSQIKGAAAPYGWALGFSFTDIAASSSLVALFDQFRIKRITVRITASQNTSASGQGTENYIVPDYDNSTLLTSVANAQDYGQACIRVRGSDTGNGESMTMSIVPCVPVASNLGNTVIPAPWQDMAVVNNTHYGIKGWYVSGAVTDPVWDVDAQYEVECINLQ
jgi:hypothetical protein